MALCIYFFITSVTVCCTEFVYNSCRTEAVPEAASEATCALVFNMASKLTFHALLLLNMALCTLLGTEAGEFNCHFELDS